MQCDADYQHIGVMKGIWSSCLHKSEETCIKGRKRMKLIKLVTRKVNIFHKANFEIMTHIITWVFYILCMLRSLNVNQMNRYEAHLGKNNLKKKCFAIS